MRRTAFASVAFGFLMLAAACVGSDPDRIVDPVPDGAPPTTTPPTNDKDSGSPGDGDGGNDPRCLACRLGCDDAGTCHVAVPSTAAAGDLPSGQADLVLIAPTVDIDTTTGEIKDGTGVVIRAGDVDAGAGKVNADIGYVVRKQADSAFELAVFTLRSLTINAGVVVTFKGKYVPVIVASGDISIKGTLSIRPNNCAPESGGPFGGGTPSLPPSPLSGGSGVTAVTGTDQPACAGGGGGGNESAGGQSGSSSYVTVSSTPALGGAKRKTSLLELPILYSGGGGGNGSTKGSLSTANGGRGAGALKLVASGFITVDGVLDASGCGGGGGKTAGGSCTGGGGGGAGGTVLLEAAAVRVAGKILANGGGGGGGTNLPTTMASNGENGRLDSKEPASGGASVGDCPVGGKGDGSDVANAPGKCAITSASSTGVAGAGGGGAAGHIVVRTLAKTIDIAGGGLVYPAALTDEVLKK